MEFTTPMSLPDAVARLEKKTAVGSRLDSRQWAELELGLRDRAFFSAGVENVSVLAEMQSRIKDALALAERSKGEATMDKSRFVSEMRGLLGAAPGDTKDLQDITSGKRLGLIYDFQKEDAMEYGRFLAGQDPDVLDAFPAQELIRVESRQSPRDWSARWADAGGKFYDGRMIARKDDPIWRAISRFGRPWPPFDFGSGMGLEDIDREEAEALGVIAPEDSIAPQASDFNAGLEASIPKATPLVMDSLRDMFGDQIEAGRDGKVVWQGERINRLFEQAIKNPNDNWSLSLGKAPASVAQAAPELKDAELIIDAQHLRHIDTRHGSGAAQPKDQRPVDLIDLRLIPHVWRAPESIKPGTQPGTLEFSATIAGRQSMVVFNRGTLSGNAPSNKWGVKTLWVKKGEAKP
jgi:hypothetical protein